MYSKFFNRISILTIFVMAVSVLSAQDLIYSQFNSMPLAINPAFAGNNSCNYRMSAIGRSQWMGVENAKSYQSATIGGDFNLNNIYDEKYNIWGLGLLASYDKSGLGSFTNYSLTANLAYHARFGDEGKNFISFGMQAGIAQRGVDIGKYIFADELDAYGRPVRKSGESFISDSKIYPELAFGSLITLNPSDNLNLYGGLSIFHLLSPNISFTNEDYKLPMRVNFHAGANFYKGGFFYLPSIYFQHQQLTNYNIGTYVGAAISAGDERTNPVIAYVGLWYKSSDAITPAVRMDIGRMTLAFSYDIHVGGVSQNLAGIGSPELSVNFYGCFGRSSKRTGCPSL
jgi:type IX secretion system PorP/SprF family membrane protein